MVIILPDPSCVLKSCIPANVIRQRMLETMQEIVVGNEAENKYLIFYKQDCLILCFKNTKIKLIFKVLNLASILQTSWMLKCFKGYGKISKFITEVTVCLNSRFSTRS